MLPREQVVAHVAAVKAGKRTGVEKYTDDTAMARQIALSFVEQKKLDVGAIARRFTEEQGLTGSTFLLRVGFGSGNG